MLPRRLTFFLAVTLASTCLSWGFPASESADDGFGKGVTLLRDHADPAKFYYVPSVLRLTTRKNDGLPNLTIIKYTGGQTFQGIFQMQVTAGLSDDDFKAAEQYLEGKYKVTPKLSAAGPMSECQVGILFVNKDNELQSWGLVKPKPDVATPSTPPPADERNTTKSQPGPTWLTQPFWLQFDASGLEAQVYEALLRGEGGIIAFLVGKYESASPEFGVDATLNVTQAVNYFQSRNVTTSGWRVGPFGNKKTAIEEKISSSMKDEGYLKVKWLKDGDDKNWQQVEAAMWKFILENCFVKKEMPAPGAGPPVSDIPEWSTGGGTVPIYGFKVNIPPVPLSFGKSQGSFSFDYNHTATGTREFHHHGRFIRWLQQPMQGRLSLPTGLTESDKAKIFKTLPSVPRVFVYPPRTDEALSYQAALNRAFGTARITVSASGDKSISYKTGGTWDHVAEEFVPGGVGLQTIFASDASIPRATLLLEGAYNQGNLSAPTTNPGEISKAATFSRTATKDGDSTYTIRFDDVPAVRVFRFRKGNLWPAESSVVYQARLGSIADLKPLSDVYSYQVKSGDAEFALALPPVAELVGVTIQFPDQLKAGASTIKLPPATLARESANLLMFAETNASDFLDGEAIAADGKSVKRLIDLNALKGELGDGGTFVVVFENAGDTQRKTPDASGILRLISQTDFKRPGSSVRIFVAKAGADDRLIRTLTPEQLDLLHSGKMVRF